MEVDKEFFDEENKHRQAFIAAGGRLIGEAIGQGEKRAIDVANAIITSPLLSLRNKKITKLLINVTAGDDLVIGEVETIVRIVRKAANLDESNIFWGLAFDDTLQDSIKVTVLAQFT